MGVIETKIIYDGGVFPPVPIPASLVPLINEVGWRFVVSEPSEATYEAVISFRKGIGLPDIGDKRYVPLAAVLARMNNPDVGPRVIYLEILD